MAEYDALTVGLPRDSGGRRFMGISGKIFRAFKTASVVNDTEELAAAVGLVAADGETQLLGQTTKSGSLPVTIASDDDIQAKLGIVTETAPTTDTASSGHNGRLQRIAQRLTSLLTTIQNPVLSSDEGDESATDEAIQGAATGLRYCGFSARETTGTASAEIMIHNGTGTGDPVIEVVSLGPGESRSEYYGGEGIDSAGGIFLQRVSGTTRVIGRYKVVT